MPWTQRIVNRAAIHTGQAITQRELAPLCSTVRLHHHNRTVVAFTEGQLQRVGQSAALIGRQNNPINHNLNGDLCRFGVDSIALIQSAHLAIEAHTLKPALLQTGQLFAQNRRLSGHPRCQKHQAAALRLGKYAG